MNVTQSVSSIISETVNSLGCFAPELALCVTIVGLLFARLFGADRLMPPHWLALVGAMVAFGLTYFQFANMRSTGSEPLLFFSGMLVYDPFTLFFRLFLLLFLILVLSLTVLSGIPDFEDGPDFYTLLLGATVGMMLMVSANNLLILFLGVEMASVPSFVLVGFLKGRRLSSEASLKFIVYGAGAAGVMLYGVSLLAGLTGTVTLFDAAGQPVLAQRLQLLFGGPGAAQVGVADPTAMTVVLGAFFVMVGLAFKLSLVPFHFWCPDAFEGAPAEVAGFLSVASKGAAFALLVRFLLGFVGDGAGSLTNITFYLGISLGVLAAATATFGNLAAYAQRNMKRLLAYSTIAHAGYMLMAVAALLVILAAPAEAGFDRERIAELSQYAVEALLFYLSVYLFMNLGAFAIVALIRNRIFSEEIEDYAGLVRETPVLCVSMLLCLFSLIGLPPLGGFVAKFMVFASLFEAGKAHWAMWAVLAIGAANTVFSLFYYLRPLKAMFLDPRPEGARPAEIGLKTAPAAYALMVSIPVLLFGFVGPFIQGLSVTARGVARVVLSAVRSI